MSELVDRVAKAISAGIFGGATAEGVARAAISAMREPTDRMKDAFYDEVHKSAEAKWYAMIDEALR